VTAPLDVLIPTYHRTAALAVTLTTLAFQTHQDFRIVVSDQSERHDARSSPEVAAVARLLRFRVHPRME
jgi:hypothetical protein